MRKNKIFTSSEKNGFSYSLSRTTIFFCFAIAIIPLLVSVSAESAPEHKSISIETVPEGSTLEAMAPVLSKQSGYRILIGEEYKHLLIKGKFKNVVDIEEFFRRALKGQSYSLLLDEGRKELQVTVLGKKMLIDRHIVDTPLLTENVSDFPDLVSDQKSQILAYQEKYQELGIDPVTGLSLEQLSQMKEAQIIAGAEMYENQGIDPVTGLPLEQLSRIKEAQLVASTEKYEQQGIDSVSGLPLGEIEEIRAMQVRIGKEKYQDQNVDPITDMQSVNYTEKK